MSKIKTSPIKSYYFLELARLRAEYPNQEYEDKDAIINTKSKFKKSGVHKSVFEKWREEFLIDQQNGFRAMFKK